MKKYLIIFFLFINCLPILSKSEDIYFYHLGLKDGLSQINIMSIYQDELGAMWFGTTEGLNRYNGKEIQTFKSSKEQVGLTQNIIYTIVGNNAGAIYIHADNDLIRYDLMEQKFERMLEKGTIHSITSKDNILWAAVDNKILIYDEKQKTFAVYIELDKNITGITSIKPSSDGSIWLGTKTEVMRILPSREQGKNKVDHILKQPVYSIYEDSRQNHWIGTLKDGLYKIDALGNTEHFQHQLDKNSISNNQIRNILEDKSGKIWVGTFYGLNRFDPELGVWENYVSNDNVANSLTHSSVFALYQDKQATIWVGTYFGGVNYFNTNIDVFRFYGASSTNNDYLSFPFVSKMTEDNHHNLWICTEGGALNCLDLKTRQIYRYLFNKDPEFVEYNNQKCIWYREDKDLLYIGVHNGGLCVFDINTKKAKIIQTNASQSHTLPNNTINKMQYYDGMLVLLTQAGFVKMDLKKELFYPFSDNPFVNGALYTVNPQTFLIDTKNRLWAHKGKDGLICINLKTNQIKTYHYSENKKNSFGRFVVSDIFENRDGEVFFATTGDGLFKYNEISDDFDNFTEEKDGLESNYCYSISESPSGKLIILYNKGLSFFNYKEPSEKLFRSSSNFPLIGFNFGSSAYITKDQEIFVGGVNGLVSFREDQLNTINNNHGIYFDKLYVNNKIIIPGDGSGILKKTLALCPEIDLKHGQNNFSIEFASSNYLQNSAYNYEYKLENFDKNWIVSENQIISYTNLNAGSYKLLVREKFQGKDNGNPIYELNMNIKPPFYLTPIAYFLYFIFACLVVITITKFYSWRTRMETTLLYERKEKERIEELNQTKFRFFTNISHEFRTPLTLIIAQIETLLTYDGLNNKAHNRIIRIYKNANHLQKLITELLDFRKQEQGFNKLNIERIEIVGYIKEIYDSFQEYASKKHIKFKIEYSDPQSYVYIDPAQFQKAVYNLLSNAFKYTSENGEIKMNIIQKQDCIVLQIIDNGIGISPEYISKIFDRFYQIEYRSSGLTLGTGIGLALTKEIVIAHKGKIEVSSAINEGSIFTITLRLGSSHFSDEELEQKDINRSHFAIKDNLMFETQHNEILDEGQTELSDMNKEKPSVLIVDDNEELLNLLRENFSSHYNVYLATTGEKGLEMVLQLLPDIVISDIMMPGMSGKDMCYKIKNNINTSHIPVILLTAQSSDTEIMDGFIFGADGYVSKPFNMKVLISYCNNILRNRRILYDKFAKQPKMPDTYTSISEHDQALIDKTIDIIRLNFENSEFDMTKLGVELAMGRSKLYTKIKEITGLTPNEFTLNLKLKEATHLLENELQMNISEIALHLSFSSTKYFSKCFKTFYGITPQEWRKINKKS